MSHSYLTLITVLISFGAITSAIGVVLMAVSLLRPARMTDGKAIWVYRRLSPGDLGLAFEDVWFHIRDEQTDKPLRIAGWWIPNPAAGGRCILLLHGYADSKIGSIAWAPLWNTLGYNVLAIDLRAHGESEGVYFTAGFWERHDVSQVIDQLRGQRPGEVKQMILFGVGVGAAVAAATAQLRSDIAAVVLESGPADYQSAAMTQLDRLGAPGRRFQSLAMVFAQRLAGCDFSAVRTIDMIRQISCPIMIITPQTNPKPSEDGSGTMERALQSRNRENQDAYWHTITGHLLALHAHPQEYEKRVRRFIETVEGSGVASRNSGNQA